MLLDEARDLLDKEENTNEAFNLLKKALSINPYYKETYLLISKLNEKIENEEEMIRFREIYKLFK